MKLAFYFFAVFVCFQLSQASSVAITNANDFVKRSAEPEAEPIFGFGLGGGYGRGYGGYGGYGGYHRRGYGGRGFGRGGNIGGLLATGAIVGGAALAGAAIGSSLRG